MRGAAISAALLALAGCSGGGTVPAENEVVRFHQRLDAGQLDAIWSAEGPEMKQTTSRQQLDAFLGGIRDRLGRVKTAKRTEWRVYYGTGGNSIELTYSTEFERGAATEQFVFRPGDPPILAGYHIKSPTTFTP